MHFSEMGNTDNFIWSSSVWYLLINSSVYFSSSSQKDNDFPRYLWLVSRWQRGRECHWINTSDESFFLPLYQLLPDLRSWETTHFDGSTSSPALSIKGSDSLIRWQNDIIRKSLNWKWNKSKFISYAKLKYRYFCYVSTCSLYDQYLKQCTKMIAGFCPSNDNEYFCKIGTAHYFKRWIFV